MIDGKIATYNLIIREVLFKLLQ